METWSRSTAVSGNQFGAPSDNSLLTGVGLFVAGLVVGVLVVLFTRR